MAPSTSAATLNEAFRATVAAAPDRIAVRTLDDAVSLTYAELARRVDALAGGLARLGVRRGDTVALMIGNRPGVPPGGPGGDDARGDAVLALPDPVAGADRLRGRRRRRAAGDRRAGAAAEPAGGAPRAARPEARDPHRRRRRRHHPARRGRGLESRASTPRRRGARSRPTTSSRSSTRRAPPDRRRACSSCIAT